MFWKAKRYPPLLINLRSHLSALFKKGLARPISFLFVAFLMLAMLMANLRFKIAAGDPNNLIAVNPSIRHQRITGWDAVSGIGQEQPSLFKSKIQPLLPELYDQAVNNLGINRIRVDWGVYETTTDFWTMFWNEQITEPQMNQGNLRTFANDNSDPFAINWSGFQFSKLDFYIDNVVIPLKQRLEAKGEKLYLYMHGLNFDAVNDPPGPFYTGNPEEYAELILATYLHMQQKYGFVPDAVELANEPDNTRTTAAMMAKMLVAAGNRLRANGFNPKFHVPATLSMANAVPYFDTIVREPGALQYITELSYHRYGGVSAQNLQAIASRAAQHGITTGMTELIGADFNVLHEDLKIGRVSGWEQFILAGPLSLDGDNGAKYFIIDDRAAPKLSMGSRTRLLRQYFKWVRAGAVRIEATSNNSNFDPLAFINPDGGYVVIIKAGSGGGSCPIQGLPAGTYGARYTHNWDANQFDVDLGDQTISSGQALNVSIPNIGVVTVFAKSAGTPSVGASALRFAQFANGDGIKSTIILTNPSSSSTANGALKLFRDPDGGPLFVSLNNGPPSDSIAISIPPLGSRVYSSDGLGTLVVGSVLIESNGQIGGVSEFFAPGIGIAGVSESAIVESFIAPVRRDSNSGFDTGVAIANFGSSPVTLTLALRHMEGREVARRTWPNLAVNGHMQGFIGDLFAGMLPPGFKQGTLTVTTNGGKIGAIVLGIGATPGDFITFPVTPLR